MIDLHLHSLLSDGVLLPSELARRCEDMGFKVIAITDHVDRSNMQSVVPGIVKACIEINKYWPINAIPGIEITHSPVEIINDLAKEGRGLGAKIVVLHGETLVEPVLKGTNHAGVLADIDILAHPGLIEEEDARIASENNVYLELSGRKGHSFTNGHVVKMSQKTGAPLIFNSDSHTPGDLLNKSMAAKIIKGAGVFAKDADRVFQNSELLVSKIL